MSDPVFGRRLAHAQRIAQEIHPSPLRRKPKAKQRDRHRVIGSRLCLCGETFAVTTKRPEQKSCGRYCIGRISALAQGAKRGNDSRRLDVWQREVRAALADGRITVGALVDLCARAYAKGYRAGYKIGRRGYEPTIGVHRAG